jgi:hypothetical protein
VGGSRRVTCRITAARTSEWSCEGALAHTRERLLGMAVDPAYSLILTALTPEIIVALAVTYPMAATLPDT